MTALRIAKDMYCLRGSCKERLKYEIEYGQKRGTTENSYLIKVGHVKEKSEAEAGRWLELGLAAALAGDHRRPLESGSVACWLCGNRHTKPASLLRLHCCFHCSVHCNLRGTTIMVIVHEIATFSFSVLYAKVLPTPYHLQGQRSNALIDIPHQAFGEKYLACLESMCDPGSLSHVFITYLDVKAIPTLLLVLEAATNNRPGDVDKLQVSAAAPVPSSYGACHVSRIAP